MTAEQIEELRILTALASSADTFSLMLPADTTEVDLKWIEAARNGLARLLDERERLLAALKDCVEWVTADEYWHDEERHKARAAIAFAEADSDGH